MGRRIAKYLLQGMLGSVADGEKSMKLTFNSSRILALGLSSLSSGPLRWLRTNRRCFASTGFSRAISGSTIGKRSNSDE
jgi:hypothetical protein